MRRTFDAGVDWVTTTVRRESPDFESAWTLYTETLERAQREGHQVRPWRWNRYEGWIAGPVRIGIRDDTAICMVSGATAHQFGVRLGETLKFPRLSRFDIQLTGQDEEDADSYIRETFFVVDGQGRKGARNVEYGLDFMQRPRTGKTLEFGARCGDRFGRLYNKTREQKGLVEAGLFRLEVESKRKQAVQLFNLWRAANYSRVWCADFVSTWFSERGMDMDWVDRENVISCPSSYEKTTLEKQVRWIDGYWGKTARAIVQAGGEDWLRSKLFREAGPDGPIRLSGHRGPVVSTPPGPEAEAEEIDYAMWDRFHSWPGRSAYK